MNFLVFFFWFFWTGSTLLFDAFVILHFTEELHARDFHETEGVITRVSLRTEGTGEDERRVVDAEYRFEVDGVPYFGTVIRRPKDPMNRGARTFVERNPVGMAVKVFYDPANPNDAVLFREMTGEPIFLSLFSAPFNLVAAVMTFGILMKCFGIDLRVDPVKVIRDSSQVRLSVATHSYFGNAFIAFFVSSILAVLACGFIGIATWPPSIPLVLTAWILVIATSVLYPWKVATDVKSGKYDIVVDMDRGVIDIPKGLGGPLSISANDFVDVAVDTERSNDSDSADRFVVVVKGRGLDGSDVVCRMSPACDRQQAEAICAAVRHCTERSE